MNSQDMHRGSRVVGQLAQKNKQPEVLLEQLYLATLTRRPTDEERQIVLRHLKSQPDPTRALYDVVWALLNSTEFATNH
jgi:hypothetical protein